MDTTNLTHFTSPPAAQADWAYFLDVDGTLIDIAETPEAAHTDAELLALLARLLPACGGALALVTGRNIADIEQRIAGLRIPIAGQHGLERRDANMNLHLQTANQSALQRVRQSLAPLLKQHPELILEDKGLSMALHYRQAPQLTEYLLNLLTPLVAQTADDLRLLKGKCVLEIRPLGNDKGTAITSFLAEPPFYGRRPVFIGDDVTDEHGFAIVNDLHGISIKVGDGPSCAHYHLQHVRDVRDWLDTITKGITT